MCGIGGCIGAEASSILVRKMSELTRHRGPDDYGEYSAAGVSLFSNRLSIIDIEGGRQPILNEDESLVIVFNGEIYNFMELRQSLELQGHKFTTRTDTEVILHGFEQHGTRIFSMLDGMFAIALWDTKKKRLLLARDRAGIKPLYYAKSRNGDLIFCSEIKGLLVHEDIPARVNTEGLYFLVSLYYIPFEMTLFEGVSKIPPGHYFDSETNSVYRYWTPPSLMEGLCPSADQVRNAVEESVRRQLVSDVKVGSFLSGGLDTSSIVAFASKHYSHVLKTFCMGFGHEDDELLDAQVVADHFGTDHHSFIISDRDTLNLYPRMIWHSEQPKLNTYSWFVNEYASKFVKVCLSGLGGDELFFGYPTSSRFDAFQKVQRLANMPGAFVLSRFTTGKKRKILSNIRNRSLTYLTTVSPVLGHLDKDIFSYPIETMRKNLVERIDKSYFQNNNEFVQQVVYAEFGTKLPDDFLSIDDSMSMAHSMENRVPFLDNQLLDLMLPTSYKFNYFEGTGKALLRKAMAGILPDACFRKAKQGFSLDVRKWWDGELGEQIRNTISESPVIKTYFNVARLRNLIPNAKESYSKVSLLWQLYAFDIWHGLFIESRKESIASAGPRNNM